MLPAAIIVNPLRRYTMGFLDSVPKIIIAGIVLLSSLGIVYAMISLLVSSKAKAKIRGVEIDASGEVKLPCIDYVKEHSDLLTRIGATLEKMESQREAARAENSESAKVTHRMFKHILTCQDAMLEAMQKSNIGNGNIEKARQSIAKCYDVQDKYLVDQI
jgi:hypothetical protein